MMLKTALTVFSASTLGGCATGMIREAKVDSQVVQRWGTEIRRVSPVFGLHILIMPFTAQFVEEMAKDQRKEAGRAWLPEKELEAETAHEVRDLVTSHTCFQIALQTDYKSLYPLKGSKWRGYVVDLTTTEVLPLHFTDFSTNACMEESVNLQSGFAVVFQPGGFDKDNIGPQVLSWGKEYAVKAEGLNFEQHYRESLARSTKPPRFKSSQDESIKVISAALSNGKLNYLKEELGSSRNYYASDRRVLTYLQSAHAAGGVACKAELLKYLESLGPSHRTILYTERNDGLEAYRCPFFAWLAFKWAPAERDTIAREYNNAFVDHAFSVPPSEVLAFFEAYQSILGALSKDCEAGMRERCITAEKYRDNLKSAKEQVRRALTGRSHPRRPVKARKEWH